jgi:hypothetical protein
MEESFDLSLFANGQSKLYMKNDSVYCHLDDTIFGEKVQQGFPTGLLKNPEES